MVFVAWQHSRVAELGGTRGDPFAGRRAPQPVAQKANRGYAPPLIIVSCRSIIDDFGRLGSHFDCGNTGAGRLDRRWTTRRRSQTGTETNHAACQDEKAGHLTTYPSGRNRCVRRSTEGCSDLKASLPFHLWNRIGRWSRPFHLADPDDRDIKSSQSCDSWMRPPNARMKSTSLKFSQVPPLRRGLSNLMRDPGSARAINRALT